ncbi:hypothetical protein THAOC_37031 [Thalassiosira oceanica]|uniref:Uncharacterized protein n=1 Tax=Thalassiosira oceanica TaxID=159749 RepID=K0R0U0_THAOC|nr:hypothetical protein THAOC_37031 [Thalassiosira oceanica]|eukprot:EJK44429.1 hypothetical protein THAOC_37031 [Thalassiosira oceanica]
MDSTKLVAAPPPTSNGDCPLKLQAFWPHRKGTEDILPLRFWLGRLDQATQGLKAAVTPFHRVGILRLYQNDLQSSLAHQNCSSHSTVRGSSDLSRDIASWSRRRLEDQPVVQLLRTGNDRASSNIFRHH